MTRIAIAGWGNLGRAAQAAIRRTEDLQLTAIFTRRDPGAITPQDPAVPVYALDSAAQHAREADVLLVCGGSATDLPTMTPALAKYFNVIDSFDTHANVEDHFQTVDCAAKESGHLALISCGWDPGLFSLMRTYAGAILPEGEDYTFWGRGVSQGHSDAVRRIAGVVDARQYTVPVPEAVEAVRAGQRVSLTTRQKHTRECYVVAEEGADQERIRREIVTMPNYFSDYDTTVSFITAQEMRQKHSGLPHGGFVIRTGVTGEATPQTMELRLALGSNPEFTSSVLVAYARAVARMAAQGQTGCRTVLDVPPALLSPLSPAQQRAHLI